MSKNRDTIYTEPLADSGLFTFDERVATVFPDMIRRSVPGYPTIIAMTGLRAGKYASEGSNLYDLGCSLGASTLSMRENIQQDDCHIIAVDNSEAMLSRCREIVATGSDKPSISLVCSDLQDVAIVDASVVVMNFTLQFIPLPRRDEIIARVHAGLRPGGIMVLSEKVTFEDPHLDALNIELHHQFKRANGYSELEVAQKRAALENVLLPETLAEHKRRITAAGFSSCDVWFQCFNFASLVARK